MKQALLIHGGAVGDFVMSLRVVAALRQAGARYVAILGRPQIAAIAGPPEGGDTIMDLEAGGFHALFSADLPLPQHVVAQLAPFDLAVDMLGGSPGPTRKRLIEAGIKRVVDLDPRPRLGRRRHVSEQWLADLSAAGIEADVGPPTIHIDKTALHQARRRLAVATGNSEQPLAILHPGSGSPDKCWPLPGFIELAGTLQDVGWRALFLLGPVELERLNADEMGRLRAAAPTLTGSSLPAAAALIAATQFFIGNDSGMSHLAAALGVATIAVFGPTDPAIWRPLGEQVSVIQGPAAGQWPSVDDVFRGPPPITPRVSPR
jgi:ADP-heptose:LPS heptosyltransferase